jgi:hypothetical protein
MIISKFEIILFFCYQYFEELNYCVRFGVECHVNVAVDEDIYTVDWYDCIYPSSTKENN